MKILMLGWEFPPFISGGLGTACYGLTRALSQEDVEVIFVLPRPVPAQYSSHVRMANSIDNIESWTATQFFSQKELKDIKDFERVSFRTINSVIQPYQTKDSYTEQLKDSSKEESIRLLHETLLEQTRQFTIEGDKASSSGHYEGDLYKEVQRYAKLASLIALREDFDVVHAHDWMTYPAGLAVAAVSGKPLVVHIHSTEFDRSGENVNQVIYDIERQGLHCADAIIAVSQFTKNIVLSRYGIADEKVTVVYNAIEKSGKTVYNDVDAPIKSGEKVVLFLGRITMQKGPDYFIAAAKKVLDHVENVKFVMAGSGDMARRMIEMAAEYGIGHKVLFTGFLRGADVDKAFRMADLFVMPSVSEPFGLVPLEALRNDVPVLISKQSGVAEVLNHVLKVDFWDVDEMANKIIAVLKHTPLQTTLREYGNYEVRKFSWQQSAQKCVEVYNRTLSTAVKSHS